VYRKLGIGGRRVLERSITAFDECLL
jgi:hypothetical protein